MQILRKKTAHATITLMALGSMAIGGGLDKSRIPADAGWVIHGDCDRLRKTAVGAYLLDELQTEEAERKFAAFKVMFAFDPRHDIQEITLYGKGAGSQDGIAVLRGDFDTKQLVTLLRANDSYGSETFGKHTIHRWLDEKKSKITFGAVHTDNSVLISEALDLVKKGLDVLDGKLPSLASENPFGDMLPAAADSCITAAANFKGVAMDPSASLLKQATAGSLTLTEQGGQVVAALSLKAGQEETAAQMAKVVRGIMAFAILGEPQNPTMAALARRVNVSTNDGATTINLTAPAAEIIDYMKAEKSKAEARKSSAPTLQPQ